MPPKILRSQDTPPPLVIWHATSNLLQLISSTEEKAPEQHLVDDDNFNITASRLASASSTSIINEHNLLLEKEKQISQAEGKEICEKPVRVVTPTITDNQPENRKIHKKRTRLKVEGEDEMIDETGNNIISHGVEMSQKVNVEVEEIKGGGDSKSIKQKKSKTALNFQGGEKRKKKKKEQQNVDMVGEVEEEKVSDNMEHKHHGEEPVVDSKRKKHRKSQPQVEEEKDVQVET